MKKIILFFFLVLSICVHGQEFLDIPKPKLNIWLEPKVFPEGFPKVRGQLFKLLDTAIVIKYSYPDIYAEPEVEVFTLMEVPVKNIEIAMIREKGVVAESAVIGAIAGMTLGLVLGYIGTANYGDNQGSFVYGLLGAIPGGLLGAWFASSKEKYEINRNLDDYNFMRDDLIKYGY